MKKPRQPASKKKKKKKKKRCLRRRWGPSFKRKTDYAKEAEDKESADLRMQDKESAAGTTTRKQLWQRRRRVSLR